MRNVTDISEPRARAIAEENRRLKEELGEIHRRLQENERLFARLTTIEGEMLRCQDAASLCLHLVSRLEEEFSLDLVRFWLHRREELADCGLEGIHSRHLRWLDDAELRAVDPAGRAVRLIDCAEEPVPLLDREEGHIGSVALLRLGLAPEPLGVLLLGSVMRDRFAPDKGTELLQHLALMIGLCLEREITRDRMARASIRDQATGCYNRRFLQPLSRQPLKQWFGRLAPVSLFCISAETGEGTPLPGERLHAAIVRLVRKSDPLIRMEDEQFALFLPGCEREKAGILAERLAARLERSLGGAAVQIGVACERDVAHTEVRSLIERAEQAMYIARALGGSRVELEESEPPPE